MEFLLSIPFRSILPAAGFRQWRDPLPRVSRAGAGARPAPARFARLIARACEAGARHTSPVCFSGCFSRRREPEDEAAPRGCRFSPPASYSHRQFRKQPLFLNYFIYCEQIALVEPPSVPSYQRHRLRTHVKTAAHIVAPDPDPGPSLGPGGSFSSRACPPPAAAVARVMVPDRVRDDDMGPARGPGRRWRWLRHRFRSTTAGIMLSWSGFRPAPWRPPARGGLRKRRPRAPRHGRRSASRARRG